jgi:predicted GTPase
VINPIIKFASKISGKLGKVFENIKAEFVEISPKINQPKLNEILANVIPKAENYRDYRSAAPMIYPMQKPNNNVTSTYSPNININVTSNNALNENDLASKIKLHLTDAIDSHYSLSLADATGGG